MAKDTGWIKLHRSSFENRLYFSETFTRWQAWCDLLLLANHKENWFRIRGIKQKVKRGQTGFSIPELGKRWRWSVGKVRRFINELEFDNQIVLQKTNVTTLISIVNYEKFQNNDTANNTANGMANGLQVVPQTDINKNDKELEEVINTVRINEKNKKNGENIESINSDSSGENVYVERLRLLRAKAGNN